MAATGVARMPNGASTRLYPKKATAMVAVTPETNMTVSEKETARQIARSYTKGSSIITDEVNVSQTGGRHSNEVFNFRFVTRRMVGLSNLYLSVDTLFKILSIYSATWYSKFQGSYSFHNGFVNMSALPLGSQSLLFVQPLLQT